MSAVAKDSATCRICIGTGAYFSLFARHKTALVLDQVMSIANVKIKQGDGLPEHICDPCLLELERAISFKKKCEVSEVALTKSYKQLVPSETIEVKEEVMIVKKEEQEEEVYFPLASEDEMFVDTTNFTFDDDYKEVSLDSSQTHYRLQCHDCQQYFKSKCKLRVHWKREHMPKSFTCPICKRIFKSLFSYDKHNKTYQRGCAEISNGSGVRVEGVGKERMFCCSHCEYKTNRMIHIRAHLVVHSGVRPFQCDLCPKAYTQQGSLKLHKGLMHSDVKLTAECHICGKLSRSRRHLYRHIQTHTSEALQCTICNIQLKSKTSLKIHMLRHSGSKNVTCELCAATFYTMAELCNHKKVHQVRDRLFKCSLCGYRATRKYQIKKHTLKHSEDKPFPCETCGRFYETQQSLNIHLRRHLEEKKFQCPMCLKMFFRKRSVSKHILSIHNPKMLKSDDVVNLKQA